MEELPEKVKETIEAISKKRQIDEETLRKRLEEICNRPAVKDHPSDVKYPYAARVLWVEYMSKEPTKEFPLVIPFGVDEKRTTRSGNIRSTIYALVQGASGASVREIVCRDELADMPSKIALFSAYRNVHLIDKGFLEVASATKFDDPRDVNIDRLQFITKYCKLQRVPQLRDMVYYISKLNDAGFVQNEDMKIISGVTVRYNKGQRRDGSSFAVYNLKDESLGLDEEMITVGNDKVVIPTTITVWVPPRFAKYGTESELAFAGPIQLQRNDRKPFMNAFVVIEEGIVREIVGKKE